MQCPLFYFKKLSKLAMALTVVSLPLFGDAQPLIANAGNDTLFCSDIGNVLGGAPSAEGGSPPYTRKWYTIIANQSGHASEYLNDTTHPNPKLTDVLRNEDGPLVFWLEVTDSAGAKAYDSVVVYNSTFTVNQGMDLLPAEAGETVTLHAPGFSGGFPPYTYDWSPKEYIKGTSNGTSIEVVVQEQPSLNTYAIEIEDKHGCSMEVSPSEIIDLLTGYSESSDPENAMHVSASPGGFYLYGMDGFKLVEVISISGHHVRHSAKAWENGIVVSGLRRGIYLARIELEGKLIDKKVVVY